MRKLIVVGMVGTALMVFAAVSYAAVNQTFKITVKPNKAGKPIAFNVDQDASLAPGDTRLQPPPLKREKIRVNKGGVFNGPKFPKCNVATLESTGECPASTKIGTGVGSATAKPVVTDVVHGALTLYNGGNKIYLWAVPDLGPNFVTTGTVSKSPSGPYDYLLDFKVDPIITLPGAPDASVIGVHTKTPAKTIKKGRKKVGLIVAPKKCTGKWVGQAEFTYGYVGDPEEQAVLKSSINCKK